MSNRIRKINQLDSLRAFAAFSVIIFHFLPDYKLGSFPFGWVGVDVFFVISGYLITAILLKQKIAVSDKFLIIKNFIIKRALRLFPLYYLFITFFLVLMYVLGLYIWDAGDEVYFYTYTQNILFYNEGMKGTQANHLWTLAVEEQFYLMWPWLVIFISNRKLINFLLIIIPFTLLFKTLAESGNIRMLTISHFDTLGGGALIALLLQEKGEQFLRFQKHTLLAIILAAIILITSRFFAIPNFFILLSVLTLSVFLIIGCYYNFGGILGQILNLRHLNYLGKISYGLYIFHKPVPYFMNLVANKLNIQLNNIVLFSLSILLTVVTAHLSYQLFEKRFLKLKDKYDL